MKTAVKEISVQARPKPRSGKTPKKHPRVQIRVQPFPVARPKFTMGDADEGSEGN